MRGIFSLGTIGLMTGATIMIAAPTDSGAVTPIDILSQRMTQFPETVVGAPTLSENSSLLAPEQTDGTAELSDPLEPQAGETDFADTAVTPVQDSGAAADSQSNETTSVRNGFFQSQLAALQGIAGDTSEAQLAEAPVDSESLEGGESTAAEDSSTTESVEGVAASDETTDTQAGASSGPSVREEIVRSRLRELAVEPNDSADVQTNTETSGEGAGGGGTATPGEFVSTTDDALNGLAQSGLREDDGIDGGSAARSRDLMAGFDDLAGIRRVGTNEPGDEAAEPLGEAAVDGEGLPAGEEGLTAESGESATAGGGAVEGDEAGTGIAVQDAGTAGSGPAVSLRQQLLAARLSEITTGPDEVTDPLGESAVIQESVVAEDGDAAAGGDVNGEAAPVNAETDSAPGGSGETVLDAAEPSPALTTRQEILATRLGEITTGPEAADPLGGTDAMSLDGDEEGLQVDPAPEVRPRHMAANGDLTGIRSSQAPAQEPAVEGNASDGVSAAIDEMIGAQPSESHAVDDMIGVQSRESANGAGAVPENLPSEVGGHATGPEQTPAPMSVPAVKNGDTVGTVPEPATWIMMIVGFWIVAWRLRQRGGVRRETVAA